MLHSSAHDETPHKSPEKSPTFAQVDVTAISHTEMAQAKGSQSLLNPNKYLGMETNYHEEESKQDG